MRRRDVLTAIAGSAVIGAGCSAPTVSRPPTGEVDVEFRTEADRDYEVRLELLDGDGRSVDTMVSGFPPDQPGRPSFFAAGLSKGPYTLTVETDHDRTSVEWSVVECHRLELVVTVKPDGTLRTERTARQSRPATTR